MALQQPESELMFWAPGFTKGHVMTGIWLDTGLGGAQGHADLGLAVSRLCGDIHGMY